MNYHPLKIQKLTENSGLEEKAKNGEIRFVLIDRIGHAVEFNGYDKNPPSKTLPGSIAVPPSKSHTLRAIIQLGGHTSENPISIRGPIKQGKAIIHGEDSQPISGMLIAGIFCPLELEVHFNLFVDMNFKLLVFSSLFWKL